MAEVLRITNIADLRAHLAGMAMQGLLSNPATWCMEPADIASQALETAEELVALLKQQSGKRHLRIEESGPDDAN